MSKKLWLGFVVVFVVLEILMYVVEYIIAGVALALVFKGAKPKEAAQ